MEQNKKNLYEKIDQIRKTLELDMDVCYMGYRYKDNDRVIQEITRIVGHGFISVQDDVIERALTACAECDYYYHFEKEW